MSVAGATWPTMPSSLPGLSGACPGQHCQPGMTRGKGVKEFLSGGRDSSSIISGIYLATEGQPDCRANFSANFESKDDTNFELWNCGKPTNGRGGIFANRRERTPLDDADHHQ